MHDKIQGHQKWQSNKSLYFILIYVSADLQLQTNGTLLINKYMSGFFERGRAPVPPSPPPFPPLDNS